MAEHIASRKFYVAVWAVLVVLTVVTALAARVDLDGSVKSALGWNLPLNALVALSIAGAKASLVVMFFMHLRWSDPVPKVAALAGIFWLAIMFTLTISDYLTRHWLTY